MAKEKQFKYVYIQEHYHFPKQDTSDQMGEMVAATPKKVSDTSSALRVKAFKAAKFMLDTYYVGPASENMKPDGEIKEGDSALEYRVWVDWQPGTRGYIHADRFVFVVRKVEYTK